MFARDGDASQLNEPLNPSAHHEPTASTSSFAPAPDGAMNNTSGLPQQQDDSYVQMYVAASFCSSLAIKQSH
jgi:hypothetical protein